MLHASPSLVSTLLYNFIYAYISLLVNVIRFISGYIRLSQKALKQFAIFVAVMYIAGIIGNIATRYVPNDLGLLTTLLVLVIPAYILYWFIKRYKSETGF